MNADILIGGFLMSFGIYFWARSYFRPEEFSLNMNRCAFATCITLLLVAGLSGCSTPSGVQGNTSSSEALGPESVLVLYTVKPGAEEELERVLECLWDNYRKERMVSRKPHTRLRWKDSAGTYILESFTLVGPFAAEHPSPEIRALWTKAHALCEERRGRPPVSYHPVEILTR
jgi:hypothetical protein